VFLSIPFEELSSPHGCKVSLELGARQRAVILSNFWGTGKNTNVSWGTRNGVGTRWGIKHRGTGLLFEDDDGVINSRL
jgi:hypothetical protein